MTPNASDHAHWFVRRSRWWLRRRRNRYECRCGQRTRHYDSTDRATSRPIHPKMSVAYRGVNAT